MSRRRENCRLYVGNLPPDVREGELDDIFRKYGRIRDIDVKIGKSGTMAYAFVEYESLRDAEDAVHGRDGYEFGGSRIKVEYSGEPKRTFGGGGGGLPPNRSEFRVVVSGLPYSASWQDLKDHMRTAGKVGYANIVQKGVGVVEYENREDMEYAIRKLDRTEFKNPFDKVVIKVREDRGSPIRGRSRSRSKSRDRGHKRSRSRSRSRDRERKPRSRSRSGKREDKRRDSRSPEKKEDKDDRSPSHKRASVEKEKDRVEDKPDIDVVNGGAEDPPAKRGRTPSRSRSRSRGSRGRSEYKD